MQSLELQIDQWRRKMTAALPGRDDTIRELESHLRDTIEELRRQGIAPGEAFAISARRLGDPSKLASEFNQLGLVRRPWFVVLILVLLMVAVATACTLVFGTFVRGRLSFLLGAHVITVTAAYFILLAAGVLGSSAIIIAVRGGLSDGERKQVRATLRHLTVATLVTLAAGMLLGMAWASSSLGHLWSWAPVEIGALLIITSALLLCLIQRRRETSDLVCWIGSVVGSLAVIVGWYGAAFYKAPVSIAWLSVAFGLGQIVVLFVALAHLTNSERQLGTQSDAALTPPAA